MSSIDDIFTADRNNGFDKEAWAAKKQAERNEAYELIDKTALEVAQDGNKFKTFLDVQAEFSSYSVGNALLITAQMPTATNVRDYDSWKSNNVYVNKNAKGITILEPGKEYTRDDGTIGVPYNAKKVFDISQTNARKDTVEVKRDETILLKALVKYSPVEIEVTDNALPNNVGALYDPDKRLISVCRSPDAEYLFRNIAKEIARSELADEGCFNEDISFKAYCSAYLLCKKNGLDVSSYNFSELPDTFTNMEAKDIRAELSSVREAATNISDRMSKAFEQTKPAKDRER